MRLRSDHIKVSIDTREQSRIAIFKEFFENLGYETEIKELLVGDLVCGQAVVEIKEEDITDISRLHRQGINMVKSFPHRHVVVLKPFSYCQYLYSQRNFKNSENLLHGLIASLNAMGVHVHFFPDPHEAMIYIHKVFAKSNDNKVRGQIKIKTTEITGTDTERIYASQIGVGDTMARELAKRYPVPNDFFSQALDCHRWKAKDWKGRRLSRYKHILETIRKRFYGVTE